MPDGSRAQRSTKTTNRKAALKMAIQFEQAAKTHLTEVQARRVIADIYRNHSGRRLESASIKDYLTRWASLRKRLKILRVALQQAWRDGLVTPHPHSKRGSGRSTRRQVSELSFHSLRHTVTSLLKSAGISGAIVQEFVGHDSKAVSQNYTHIDTEVLRKAAELLPDLSS